MSILIFIIILLVLVLAHEFGHFFTAKRFGIRVDEFGFGFPPKLFGFKKGETEYTVNLLPIGGFVKIFGEDPNDENTNGPDKDRSFVSKPKWQQAIVLFAGIFANLLLAWVLFSFGFMSGLPTSVDAKAEGSVLTDVHLVVIAVAPKSPAETAGLKSGDKITDIGLLASFSNSNDYIENPGPDELKNFIVMNAPRVSDKYPIAISYIRGNNEKTMTFLVPENNTAGVPTIGISMDEIGIAKLSIFQAFYQGMKLTITVAKGTIVGLFTLIYDGVRGHGSFASVTGPVGMVGIVGDAYQFGFAYLLSFAALISINLAVINVIPFPALDGGRLFFLLIEKVKGSPLNPKFSNTANMVGFGILILLMLVVTYHDVVKLF